MGIEKSQFKMAVAHELGAGFDDLLDKAVVDTHKWLGAKTALADAVKAVEKLLDHVRTDVKEEEMTIEESNAVTKYINRATAVLDNLRLKSEVHEQRAHGRVDALKSVVKVTKVFHDREQAKAGALQRHQETEALVEHEGAPESDGEVSKRPPARPVGARPVNAVGARKQADKAD